MRKQLDVLMGANRNGDVEEVNRNYYDRDVCRLFLAGLCPHDLFQLTVGWALKSVRSNFASCCCRLTHLFGDCRKWISDLVLRFTRFSCGKSILRLTLLCVNFLNIIFIRKSTKDHNFDTELEDMIERLIVECDRKIQRALKRLADEDAKAAIAISVSETDEILQLSKQIKEKMKEVDTFDFEGRTDDKIKAQEVVEELRAKRADMQATLLLDAFNKDRASLPTPAPPPQVAAVPPPPPPDARTQEMINEKLKKAEELGEQGMVDEAQKALEEAEALKKVAVTMSNLIYYVYRLAPRPEPPSDPSKYTVADVRIVSFRTTNDYFELIVICPMTDSITDQKLRLCDICGAFLSVYDNDRRLADHFGGKLHLGYMLIREKLKELQVLSVMYHFLL
ncbi:hypothetical protein HU200_030139 [Digitaria exilis]|uniref:LUC7 related protein n=1 Tax=Digitaria exilis TaxID=1010633 RepID=A0A835EUE7_9POAL|nr:hypothetical protein HU200_030139 [Digitaria exilis]